MRPVLQLFTDLLLSSILESDTELSQIPAKEEEEEMGLLGRKAHGFWLIRVKSQVLVVAHKPPWSVCSVSFLSSFTTPPPPPRNSICSSHTGLLPCCSSKHSPTPGPLHWLFPLPGTPLSPSHRTQASTHVPPLQGPSPAILSQAVVPHP